MPRVCCRGREQDDSLENHLVIAQLNQRGVTGCAVFAGGDQERTQAGTYREHAEEVRSRWPRSGALLEAIASVYEGDGRREDRQAEREARGLD